MNVKTVRRIPTFIVLAVLFVGFWMVRPSIRTFFDSDDDGVLLVVQFEPAKRTGAPLRPGGNVTDAVTIMASMATEPIVPRMAWTASPWSKAVFPRKGEVIDLYAEQFSGGKLSCQILYNGKQISRSARTGPASIRCLKTFLP